MQVHDSLSSIPQSHPLWFFLLFPLLPFGANSMHMLLLFSRHRERESVQWPSFVDIRFTGYTQRLIFQQWLHLVFYVGVHTYTQRCILTHIHTLLTVKLYLVWRKMLQVSREMGLAISTWQLFLVYAYNLLSTYTLSSLVYGYYKVRPKMFWQLTV